MGTKTKEIIIKSNRPWWDLELSNFWHYKDLIFLFIRRDFVTSYKQTILGPFWVIIQALLGSAIFTVIFGNIAGLSTDGHPAFLFYLCGSLAWQYFGSALGVSSTALQAHCGLFSKVHFPRFIPPVCDIISALQNFIIQLVILLIAIGIYKFDVPDSNTGPILWAVLLPLLVLQSAMLGMGVGFLISSASVKYRDVGRISGLLTQFLMYASPVIYPISEIPARYQPYLAYNPLTFIVESYRFVLLGHSTACSWEFAIPSITTTLILFVLGLLAYNKTQRSYVDFV